MREPCGPQGSSPLVASRTFTSIGLWFIARSTLEQGKVERRERERERCEGGVRVGVGVRVRARVRDSG